MPTQTLNVQNKYIKKDEYTQITTNVYKFNNANDDTNETNETNETNDNNEIYILYSNACEMKSIDLFKQCKALINNTTKENIIYEIFLNLALLTSIIGGPIDEVGQYYTEAIKIYSDRAEPYYYWGIYCNKNKDFNNSYDLLNLSLIHI